MNNKGFTLIELLATVVILGILFLFLTPKILNVIKNAENKNKQIIETKLIDAGKEYVTDYNKEFIQNFVNVNDYGCISISELIDVGLVDQDEVSILDGAISIKVKLLADDNLEYTICYASCC
jgi:prepilin-type N-terminal cleavage/methylation domain-containing protein